MKAKIFIIIAIICFIGNVFINNSLAQDTKQVKFYDLSVEIIKSYKTLDILIKNAYHNKSLNIPHSDPSFNKFNSITNDINKKTHYLTHGIKNSIIAEDELVKIIELFHNNINCYSTMKPTYDVLKFCILNNKFNKNTTRSIESFFIKFDEQYKNRSNAGCAVVVMVGVTVVVGGALAAGAMHSHNTNQQVHPNIQNDDGSTTMVPYGNHGEPIQNDDGSVTMIPYGK